MIIKPKNTNVGQDCEARRKEKRQADNYLSRVLSQSFPPTYITKITTIIIWRRISTKVISM